MSLKIAESFPFCFGTPLVIRWFFPFKCSRFSISLSHFPSLYFFEACWVISSNLSVHWYSPHLWQKYYINSSFPQEVYKFSFSNFSLVLWPYPHLFSFWAYGLCFFLYMFKYVRYLFYIVLLSLVLDIHFFPSVASVIFPHGGDSLPRAFYYFCLSSVWLIFSW